MRTLLLLLGLSCMLPCAAQLAIDTPLPDSLSVTVIADTVIVAIPEVDTTNITDSLGLKQGYWTFFGSDFTNSGVASSDIFEEGYFVDNQRTGIWYRYGPNQQVQSVMLYHVDPKSKTAVRDQFYHYSYHSNGTLKRKPAIGKCRTLSDYFNYNENGDLIEIELFDSICNTRYKLQRIQKGELDSIPMLLIDSHFTETSSAKERGSDFIHFDQTGEFCVDFNHQIFQIGTFVNGKLIEGKEYFFDELMRAEKVRFYAGGKIVKTVIKKAGIAGD